ncbi:MAG: hypothetical protein EXQ71_00780 [Acidimicrobiia bacterium]|nr:hypothetical protein [Acidimicrobiia bacterium]
MSRTRARGAGADRPHPAATPGGRPGSKRIEEELATEIGEAVAYTIRLNDCVGPDTSMKVMTNGVRLAAVQRDHLLMEPGGPVRAELARVAP